MVGFKFGLEVGLVLEVGFEGDSRANLKSGEGGSCGRNKVPQM
jgi:hypothetical protein